MQYLEPSQVTDPETNETNEHRDFAIAEAIFITWFTIEYCVRYCIVRYCDLFQTNLIVSG